jgi:hypothetical protein
VISHRVSTVATIAPFLSGGAVFDPNDIQAMSAALDDVCNALNVGGNNTAKEVIAVRIIELARRGERRPIKLRERLLAEANGVTGSLQVLRAWSDHIMSDNAFASDAAYFDIVAEQAANPDDRRQLHKVADEYRRLAKKYVPVPGQTRVEFWSYRAERCRSLSDKFPSKICCTQLLRLASAYDLMAELCEGGLEAAVNSAGAALVSGDATA